MIAIIRGARALSYLVLARKYRPQTLEDLVGQEAVAKGLSQALTSGRIGHAFLFVGSRGTGKTSTARILAKALNCAKGPTATPCGKCDSCRAIEDGSDVDVLEIDAASNNSVDNIRELRENVGFAPMRGRYRITILDEVHMLSGGAFNALLKTLEEPPAHAKFLFATTAPEKIPDTIRSRCQVYEFRRIEAPAIAARLARICELEKITPGPGTLAAIARIARGGMRDSLSLLDQLVAYAGNAPAEADLARLTGMAGREAVAAVADAVIAGDRPELLRRVAAHVGGGGEPVELVDQLLEHFRSALAVALCGADTDVIEENPELRAKLADQAKRCGADRLEAILRYLVFAREKARFAGPLVRAAVESALLSASRSGEVATIPALLERLEALERKLGSEGGGMAPVQAAPVQAAVPPAARAAAAPMSPAPFRSAPARAETTATIPPAGASAVPAPRAAAPSQAPATFAPVNDESKLPPGVQRAAELVRGRIMGRMPAAKPSTNPSKTNSNET